MATSIDIFVEPANVFQHGVHDPCIFADNKCNDDPADWPDPVSGLTSNVLVTQTFDIATWNKDVGSQFVLGFDINNSSTDQTLSSFAIFIDASATPLYAYTASPGTALPDANNGTGWADYLLAPDPGCTSPINVGNPNFMNCAATNLAMFDISAATTSVTFKLFFTNNDGPDTIFAIPCPGGNCAATEVPEPASLLLLGTGLTALAVRYRRRRPSGNA